MTIALGILLGFTLSFLSFGILWTGINQWAQSVVTILFFILCYLLSRRVKNAMLGMMIGAAPAGGIIMLFRDKNDSHLLGVSIVASWVAAAGLATYLNRRKA